MRPFSPKLWFQVDIWHQFFTHSGCRCIQYVVMVEDNGVVLCVFAGHGFLPGGASPAGDPRPAASLLHQPGRPAAAGAQELRHEERWSGQVRLTNTDLCNRYAVTFYLLYQLQLSRVEFPPVPQRILLPLCTWRDLTSGSLQNRRGRLAIIPRRATSISRHCIFHWTNLPLSSLPPIYPSPRCFPSWVFLYRPQWPNENFSFVCFIWLLGVVAVTLCNESFLR